MKVNKEDLYSIALLYIYHYSKGLDRMLSEDSLNRFVKIVDANLDELEVTKNLSINTQEEPSIYFCSENEEGTIYYILRNDVRINELTEKYVVNAPTDLLLASQMPNALDSIGLVRVGEIIVLKKIMKKLNEEKTLIRK